MPRKKKTETPKQQAARFAEEVERMIAAGELNPTDAQAGLESLVQHSKERANERHSS